ncbi:MAG: zinc-ribbon domain-containing protein [Candidatus Krumholzibacteria bacterium]|nr:zinc-ribbon domain-containing protein [Candidatus Krumholzibacteria bacterium]
MIVTCNGCNTKYLLGDDKVPEIGIRVRCPKCRFVWRLAVPAAESIFEVSSGELVSEVPVAEDPESRWSSMEASRTAVMAEPEAEDIKEQEVEISEEKPAAAAKQAAESPDFRKKKERARRLARVYVSDVLVYNREKRDQGLANGALMSALGPEIKKSWEAYKEKVGPEFVESSNYFRDALNEILADGQKIF